MALFHLVLSKRMPLALMVLTLCGGTVAARAQDQEQLSLAPGTRIRITTAPPAMDQTAKRRLIVGSLVAINDVAVSVTDQHADTVQVPRASIDTIERSAGRKSRGKNAALGLLIGAIAGAVVTGASANTCTGFCIVSPGGAAILGGLFFGGIGAAVGAAIPPGERWVPISSK